MLTHHRLCFRDVALAVGLACATEAGAQRRDGRVSGAVVDHATGQPMLGVTVVSLHDGKAQTTDSSGTFRFERLPVGLARFLFRAPGFPQQGLVVALKESERSEQRIELDSSAAARLADEAPARQSGDRHAQMLAPVVVAEAASMGPRYAAFERRQKTGAGQYVVRVDIEKAGANYFRMWSARCAASTSTAALADRVVQFAWYGRRCGACRNTSWTTSLTTSSDRVSPSGISRQLRSTPGLPTCRVSTRAATRDAA